MTVNPSEGVRPTRRVLDVLDLALPPLTRFLHELEHELIVKAQSLPEALRAGAAERVLTLSDRVWWKVKHGRFRGVAAQLDRRDLPEGHPECRWWIGDAGTRAEDSPQRDFYARLERLGGVSDSLLPIDWDWRRLSAELVATSAVRIGSIFRQSASKALRTGQVVVFPLGDHDVQLRVRVLDDGQAYIAIGFRTVIETDFMVLALGSMPGVKAEDWQVEPTSPLHLPLEPGEVIWSTLLSREALAWLLEVDES